MRVRAHARACVCVAGLMQLTRRRPAGSLRRLINLLQVQIFSFQVLWFMITVIRVIFGSLSSAKCQVPNSSGH